jgi:hypothetical protein
MGMKKKLAQSQARNIVPKKNVPNDEKNYTAAARQASIGSRARARPGVAFDG